MCSGPSPGGPGAAELTAARVRGADRGCLWLLVWGRYVTQDELVAMMKDDALLWSPWFKVITANLLIGKGWWKDLAETLTTDKHVDLKSIHRFGPPYPGEGFEHQGCYRASTVGAVPVAKQGAYGKLKTHSESKLSQACRLDEVFAALLFKVSGGGLTGKVDCGRFGPSLADDVAFCDAMLGKVSRSFAAVIRQLPPDLVLDCLVFYLVLRALDTIEDDMTAFASVEQKLFWMKHFYDGALHNDKWKMQGVGEGDEALLLENFFRVYPCKGTVCNRGEAQKLHHACKGVCVLQTGRRSPPHCSLRAASVRAMLLQAETPRPTQIAFTRRFSLSPRRSSLVPYLVGVSVACGCARAFAFCQVSKVYQALPAHSQAVISDINQRMGAGMGRFVAKDLGQGTESQAEYDLYCHFVAGLVGEGLSRLFVATGHEKTVVATDLKTSNAMGLFLQKTNIIRDYLEDYVDGRAWWPQSTWRKHAATGDLGEFTKPEAKAAALRCLNEMVTDALALIPECLAYLRRLENPNVFRFCAIPQVMAIATLDKCFNNHDVFTGVVKVRKGLAVAMIADSGTLAGVEAWFRRFASSIKARVDPTDPCAGATMAACDACLALARDDRPLLLRACPSLLPPLAAAALAWGAIKARAVAGAGRAPLLASLAALAAGTLKPRDVQPHFAASLTAATFLIGYAASALSYKPLNALK